MASQIAHIVYGKKIFDRNKDKNLSWLEFAVGTVFPDIRYLVKIDRSKVHFLNTSEEKIPNESSFNAGMYVHSLVDKKWQKIFKNKKLHKLAPKDWFYLTALKLVEDQLVYERYKGWDKIISELNKCYEQEYKYVPQKGNVSKWHSTLQSYFAEKPEEKAWRKIASSIGIDKKGTNELIEKASSIKANDRLVSIIKDIYKEI